MVISLRVRNVYGARNAVDVAPHDLAIAHELDTGAVSLTDPVEIGFFKVAVERERICVDDRYGRRQSAGAN